MKQKMMNREDKDKSWKFLNNCNENQLQLINDIMSDLHASGSMYGLRRNKNYCCITLKGHYITYYAFIRGIVNAMGEEQKNILESNDKYEVEENILMLSCLKSLAWKQPQYFKTLYNLASTSVEDVVEELEIAFSTSPALRASLPAVLCALLAQSFSVELSDNGKQAIDENLTTLEKDSKLGKYRYAGSFAKVLSLSNPALWALGGPVGMVAGIVYHSIKKMLSNEEVSVGQKEKDAHEKALVLACALIMLRRQICGVVWNEKQAYNKVCEWMVPGKQDNCCFSDDWQRQREQCFVRTLFLKLLKAKNEARYNLVVKLYSNTEEQILNHFPQIDKNINLLLPHIDKLFEKLWNKLFIDHSKDNDYIYTMAELKNRMQGKCLVTEFHPDFVDDEGMVHFLVDNNTRGDVILCLEIKGHNSTAICKDITSLNKEYDNIFVSDETQRVVMRSYLNPRGRVYSLYAKFGCSPKTESREDSEIQKLREELQQTKEKLEECQEQIAEYKEAATAFRHDVMKNHFLRKMRGYIYALEKGKSLEENIGGLEKLRCEMRAYVDDFAKSEDFVECSLWQVAINEFKDLKGIKIIENNQCPNECFVKIKKKMFASRVLGNIRQNILQHAFPENHGTLNPCIKISLQQETSYCVLKIENNGLPFHGDFKKVLDKGVSYGGSTGEGLYIAAQCLKRFHKGCDITTYNPMNGYSFAVEIRISNQ